VKDRCAGDADLGNVVEYLLNAYDRGMADHPADRPVTPPADADAASTLPEERDEAAHRAPPRTTTSAATSCCSRSARAASARSTWQSSSTPSAAAWR
jgi:hypothetical protein